METIVNAALLLAGGVLIVYGLFMIAKRAALLQAILELKLHELKEKEKHKKLELAASVINFGKAPEELAKKVSDSLLATGLLLIVLGLIALGELVVSINIG